MSFQTWFPTSPRLLLPQNRCRSNWRNCETAAIWPSAQLIFHLVQPVRALEHVARLAAIRRPNDAFMLHHIQNAGCAAIAETQPPLESGGGSFAHFEHNAHRFFIKRVLLAVEGFSLFLIVVFGWRCEQKALVVFRTRLLLPKFDHAIGLRLADKSPVHAYQSRRARGEEEHVAFAEQVVSAHTIEHRARIHSCRHTEADA